MRVYGRSGLWRQSRLRSIFHEIIRPRSSRRHARRFFPSNETAAGAMSTKVALSAPLLRASIPKAPLPANRSRTIAPGTRSDRMLKMASLVRSEVGRIPLPSKGCSLFPFRVPLMILNMFPVWIVLQTACSTRGPEPEFVETYRLL